MSRAPSFALLYKTLTSSDHAFGRTATCCWAAAKLVRPTVKTAAANRERARVMFVVRLIIVSPGRLGSCCIAGRRPMANRACYTPPYMCSAEPEEDAESVRKLAGEAAGPA